MSKREMHSVSLPWNEWPNADRTLWEQALIFNDLDESSTPLSTWAAQHQAAARGHYGAWLKFVAVTEPGMIAASPAARMSVDFH